MRAGSVFSFVGVVAILMVTNAANAASESPVHPDILEDQTVQDVAVPLTQSKVQVEIKNEQIQRNRALQPKSSLEAGVSSWLPRSVKSSSRLANPSSYQTINAPALALNAILPMNPALNLKTGLGLLMLHRFGELNAVGQDTDQEQLAYLVSVRMGVEWAPLSLATRRFRPYLGGNLLPTLMLTNRSALDSGSSDFGLPVELSAGSLVLISETFSVSLGVTEVLGKVADSNLTGFGMNAGLRVAL